MSVHIVGKKLFGDQQNRVQVGQSNQSQNTLYMNEHKLVKGNNFSGNFQTIPSHPNYKVISVNQAKEQQKFIYVNNKAQREVNEPQTQADVSPGLQQQNPRERIFCQIIHNYQSQAQKDIKFLIHIKSSAQAEIQKQKEFEELQRAIMKQEEEEQQIQQLRNEEEARKAQQVLLAIQEEEAKKIAFKAKQADEAKKLDEARKADQIKRQIVEQQLKEVELFEDQRRNKRYDSQHTLIIQGQIKKQLKDQLSVIPSQAMTLEETINQKVSLQLRPDSQRKQYYSRPWQEKQDIRHWGQRKLLLIEIYFLMTYGHLSKNVVYAGAAPGIHIEYLSFLFKNHTFYLYDPNEFKVQPTDKIHIFQKYFNTEESKQLHSKFNVKNFDLLQGDYLFISDVRAANYKELAALENERQILEENKQQIEWVQILQPRKVSHIYLYKSMLKFRCAYPSVITEPTEYLKGDILIQPWAPQSSTETRLIPHDDLQKITYENKVYEEQMFFHNDVTRREFFIEMNSRTEGFVIIQTKGLDGTWDACAEWMILSEYVKKFHPYQKNLEHTVSKFSRKITKKIQWEHGRRQLSDKKKMLVNDIKILRI